MKPRVIIDICMTILVVLLMGYSLVGETLHEVFGTAMLVLFIVHHILNRKWYGALGMGKYNARRVITHVAFYAGWPKAWAVFNLAKEVYGE